MKYKVVCTEEVVVEFVVSAPDEKTLNEWTDSNAAVDFVSNRTRWQTVLNREFRASPVGDASVADVDL